MQKKKLNLVVAGLKRGLDPLGKVFEYDMEGRLTNKQETTSPKGHLLAWIEYCHGALDGAVSFYENKRTGACFGKWKYKKGKLVKDKNSSKK